LDKNCGNFIFNRPLRSIDCAGSTRFYCLTFIPLNALSQETMEQSESPKPHVSRFALFLTFSRITLSGFGGVMFWARRGLVERERWLTEQEFVELLTLGQLLPGPPGLNLTVMVGYRFGGWTGAAAAVAGFLGWPCLVVIGMGVLYQHYGALPQVQRALAGMSIVAAGLLLVNFIKLAIVLPPRWRPWLFVMLAFVGVGVMRWPLLWVMGALSPWAVLAAWKEKE
jgi:chromate transporter